MDPDARSVAREMGETCGTSETGQTKREPYLPTSRLSRTAILLELAVVACR